MFRGSLKHFQLCVNYLLDSMNERRWASLLVLSNKKDNKIQIEIDKRWNKNFENWLKQWLSFVYIYISIWNVQICVKCKQRHNSQSHTKLNLFAFTALRISHSIFVSFFGFRFLTLLEIININTNWNLFKFTNKICQ